MVRMAHERILLIGDTSRQVLPALAQAMPAAQVTHVSNWFEGIAELAGGSYTSILAATEPIERRPEAAVRTLRQLAGEGRLLLFGHPTLEPISRKMLDFGADDYLVTPANALELQQMFGSPPLRLTTTPSEAAVEADDGEPAVVAPPSKMSLLMGLPVSDILLDSLVQQPHNAASAAVRRLDDHLGPTMQLTYGSPEQPAPPAPEGLLTLSHMVRANNEAIASLHLTMPRDEEESAARHFLAQLAHLVGKIGTLQDRHNRLQKLAITDDLTEVYNGRYFRHFLQRILEKARLMRFPVTLLLFDIDNFKEYNEKYGHSAGDEILKQTAALMKRCCRDHDLVARLSGGGDEFAVVFWEKEGPRQPHSPHTGTPGRPPQTPLQIFDRFRKLLSTQDFQGLGKAGQGLLTISAGLAVYPYDAHDAESLIEEADRRLMFGAKKAGKNSIVLVGNEEEARLQREQ
jgi:GGDEF domain-containing protein